jgi:hypothetical protein
MPSLSEKEAIKLIRRKADNWRTLDDKFKNDKEFILKCVKYQGSIVKWLSDDLKDDKEFMLECYKINFKVAIWFDIKLKKDEEFMLDCIELNFSSYNYTSSLLKNDKEFNIKVLKRNQYVLHLIKPDLYLDPDIVVEPLSKKPELLSIFQFSDEIKEKVVALNGLAIQYMTVTNILYTIALKQNPRVYTLTNSILKNFEFKKKVVSINGLALLEMSEEDKKDIILIRIAFRISPKLIYYLPGLMNKNTILMAFLYDQNIFEHPRITDLLKKQFCDYILKKHNECMAFKLFLDSTSCSIYSIIKYSTKKQKTISSITNKLNEHGIHFSKIFKQKINSYLFQYKEVKYIIKALELLKEKSYI